MVDTSIIVRGVTLTFKGQSFEMVSAGFKDDIAYAEVKPRNAVVEEAVIAHIKSSMPFPFSIQDIQNTLTKKK